MKKTTVIFCIVFVLITLCLTACQDKNEYVPTGEFYIKTSPSHGDAGVDYVISIEADYNMYKDDGDINVPMIVGFGHLPRKSSYSDGIQDTFYVRYQIIEAPWEADKFPAWEKRVEYTDSWYNSKYDSTEQENHSFLFIPHYGEFYPLYKETVDFVFPADVEKGYFQVDIFTVSEDNEEDRVADLQFFFERAWGELILYP